MDERLSRLESRLEDLSRRLEAVEARLPAAPPSPAPAVTEPAPPDSISPLAVVAVIGQCCLILGGAFLLRALTDAGTFGPSLGIALGFAYAACWWIVTYRVAARRPLHGNFYGLAGVAVVVFPLTWEGTVRLGVFSPPAAFLALAALAAACLALARHRGLEAMAWGATLLALGTAQGLFWKIPEGAGFAGFLLVLAGASLWTNVRRDWTALLWAGALLLDGALGLLILDAVARRPVPLPVPPILAASAAFALLHLAWFSAGSLGWRRPLRAFAFVQTAAALGIGLEGALHLSRASAGAGIRAGLGLAALALAAGGQAAAFLRGKEPSRDPAAPAYFLAVSAVLALEGFRALLPHSANAFACGLLAVAAAAAARGLGSTALAAQAAFFGLAASFYSGALSCAAEAFGSPGAALQRSLGPSLAALAPALAAYALLAGSGGPANAPAASLIPRLLLLVTLAAGAAAAVVPTLARATMEAPDGSLPAGWLAVLRTGTLSVFALVLALGARRDRFREMGWLVYPLLGAAAVKMVFEDIPLSRAATLVFSLSLLGGALVLVPLLARRKPSPP